MLQKILVPLDGSELAEQALPFARALAQKFDGKLILLWVLKPPSLVPVAEFGAVPYQNEVLIKRTRRQASAYLSSLRDDLRTESIPARVVVLSSPSVTKAIVDFASEEGVEVIVKTTRGGSSLFRWVFGRAASRIVGSAPCPVFLVRVEEDS